ncbi:MAG: hypothetical protein M3470_06975, partial [Chloroflexota bacterium]|nr:hypothetical protein [Chloroflexota bacterium]
MTGRPALTPRPALAEVGSLQRLSASFRLALRASGRSPATITAYAIGVAQLGRYLEREGLPTRADRIAKDHV